MKFLIVLSIFVLFSAGLALPQWGGQGNGLGTYRGAAGNFGGPTGGFSGRTRGLGGGFGSSSSFPTSQSQSFGFGGNGGGTAIRAKTFNSGLRGSFDS